MNCQSCGTLLPAHAKVCLRCGRPAFSSNSGSYPPAVVANSNRTSPEASASYEPASVSSVEATPPQPTAGSTGGNPYTVYDQQDSSTPMLSLVGSSDPHSAPSPLPLNPYTTPQAGSSLPYLPESTHAGPPAQKPPRLLAAFTIFVLVIVLFVVGAGLLIYSTGIYRPGLSRSQATATVETQLTRTAQEQATAAVENPYTHSGALFFTDPLHINTRSQNWDVNGNCAFIKATYHAIAPNPHFSNYCIANGTSFSNFAIELTMKIIRGDAGGILFRVENTSPNQYYDFYVGQDGTYGLEVVDASRVTSLRQSTSAAIKRGLNRENLMGIVAQGSTIMLYVNHQLLGTLTDRTYNHGQIGVYAVVYSHPTEVVFSNARVWKL
jgi:hypothetical protein